MNDVLTECYVAAIEGMKTSAPRGLAKRAQFEADDRTAGLDVGLSQLVGTLSEATPNDHLRQRIHLAIAGWDFSPVDAKWAADTAPGSHERRAAIYLALELDEATTAAFDGFFPIHADQTVVISDDFEPWYSEERRANPDFYWSAYRDYLVDVKQWAPQSVASLDNATTRVVERLSDPLREEAYPSRGLVVGYVQSGKTANFTGVIAKAVDAGYRLVIVMTGTVNLLREQTQRRIDMELVGRENILRGVDTSDQEVMASVDYQDDPAWLADEFIRHGFLPSTQGSPDIIRLTSHRFDYRSLRAGITALEFEKADKTKPLTTPENLLTCSARIIIVKKNKGVLKKLVKDLGHIKARLGEIPTLIIDDESDQASVNTSNPGKWASAEPERTAINKLISEFLQILPRAQYVGYTATPFANVFIDPSDAEDIFPKDFLLSLDRPPKYMGISDFHDLDSDVDPSDRTIENSREKAHVRNLLGVGGDRDLELLGAIDAYVLSGAIKIFRETKGLGQGYFRHHTMLVHESVRKDDHRETAETLRELWANTAYSSSSGLRRLRDLYEQDFKPVSQALPKTSDGPNLLPESFDDLKSHIGEAIARMTTTSDDPVIVVNSDKDINKEPIDFDRRSVWRILVGGAKLSRGFTVEGLTVSYYRRVTKQADTLMQMGRWFGFRNGYRDLVRLYIGRAEGSGASTIDLYAAFEGIVKVEEDFRDQLRRYAKLVDGKPQITSAQIPPLVSQHIPWLKPTATNKMFNAELVVRRSPGVPLEPVGFPQDDSDLSHNYAAMIPLLQAAHERETLIIPPMNGSSQSSFDAFVGETSHAQLLATLGQLRWIVDDYFKPDLAFLKELSSDDIADWIIMVPQLGKNGYQRALPEVGVRSLSRRERRRGPLFGGISDPKHRHAALRIAGGRDGYGDAVVENLHQARRGGILLYPVVEEVLDPPRSSDPIDPEHVIMAFVVVAPYNAIDRRITPLVKFSARNKALAGAPIVDKD